MPVKPEGVHGADRAVGARLDARRGARLSTITSRRGAGRGPRSRRIVGERPHARRGSRPAEVDAEPRQASTRAATSPGGLQSGGRPLTSPERAERELPGRDGTGGGGARPSPSRCRRRRRRADVPPRGTTPRPGRGGPTRGAGRARRAAPRFSPRRSGGTRAEPPRQGPGSGLAELLHEPPRASRTRGSTVPKRTAPARLTVTSAWIPSPTRGARCEHPRAREPGQRMRTSSPRRGRVAAAAAPEIRAARRTRPRAARPAPPPMGPTSRPRGRGAVRRGLA